NNLASSFPDGAGKSRGDGGPDQPDASQPPEGRGLHVMGFFGRFRWFAAAPSYPLGQQGERYAAKWLRRRGYKIVAGGERSRYGEIDLVAVKKRTLVFVEVKTRRSGAGGHPAEAVGPEKQRRI